MRKLPLLLVALAALITVAIGPGASDAVAQTSVATADAQPFLGDWTVALDAQGQTFTMDINVQDDGGNVAAEVSSQMGSTTVQRIAKNGENLVLSYTMDAQGQMVPVRMTLVPEDAGVDVSVDFADGMFQTTGKGTRK